MLHLTPKLEMGTNTRGVQGPRQLRDPFLTNLGWVAFWGQLISREHSGSVMLRALSEKRSNSDGEIK